MLCFATVKGSLMKPTVLRDRPLRAFSADHEWTSSASRSLFLLRTVSQKEELEQRRFVWTTLQCAVFPYGNARRVSSRTCRFSLVTSHRDVHSAAKAGRTSAVNNSSWKDNTVADKWVSWDDPHLQHSASNCGSLQRRWEGPNKLLSHGWYSPSQFREELQPLFPQNREGAEISHSRAHKTTTCRCESFFFPKFLSVSEKSLSQLQSQQTPCSPSVRVGVVSSKRNLCKNARNHSCYSVLRMLSAHRFSVGLRMNIHVFYENFVCSSVIRWAQTKKNVNSCTPRVCWPFGSPAQIDLTFHKTGTRAALPSQRRRPGVRNNQVL